MCPSGGHNTEGTTSEPPEEPAPTQNITTRVTRKSARTTHPTSEDIRKQDYEVKDDKSGAAYLEKSLLSLVGEPITTENLSTVLLHITQLPNVPRPATEAIRAVAFLMEKDVYVKSAVGIIQHLNNDLPTLIKQHVNEAIAPHIVSLTNTKKSLDNTARTLAETILCATDINIQTKEATKTLEKGTTDTRDSIDQMIAAIEKTSDNVKMLIDDPSRSQSSNAQNSRSYSDVLRAPPPTTTHSTTSISTPASAALARAALRERQILIDPQRGHSLYPPDQTTPTIVDDLKAIFDEIKDVNAPTLTIKALTRLKNGGIVIEFDSNEPAIWLHQDTNRAKFLERLSTPAEIRERSYVLLVPFLPITSPLDDPQWLRALEMENNLREDSLASARWIKRKACRNPNQRVAHAIFTFSEPKAANTLIRDGLYICKEKLHPHKEKREPLRCVRCQGWGHIARDCKAIHNACASCGHAHRTDSCTDSTGKHYCISCKSANHASNDPKCPTYLSKCAELDAKHPENSMPFFPTDEPWTQVVLPPKPPPIIRTPSKQPPPAQPPRTHMRQTTLDSTIGPKPRRRHAPHQSDTYHNNQRDIPTSSNAIPTSPPRNSQIHPSSAPEPSNRVPLPSSEGWYQ
ncbi:hypothetical protein L210DRAFT_3655331 [Boletus edulis BED1]|uniref:CCHC-type domain-containing protein n=1 Tax=Boletus edulis BED1 TaxID=1328754 RepID=A0AAD4BCT2_BOLED|nr:hypothetical protein L210DRAFT_3655331 [Boletus edulis BED1]